MDGGSVASQDGFTGKFFTFAWDIIAQDVHKAVVSFICGAELPRFFTSTNIDSQDSKSPRLLSVSANQSVQFL